MPWDALFFYFWIQKDLKFYRATYADHWSSTMDSVLLGLKVVGAVCGPAMLYLTFSYHENLRLPAQAALNDVGGMRPKTPVLPVDTDMLVDEKELSSLEWLQQTDPAAVRARRGAKTNI